jgi:hypothetical protein
MNPNRFAPQNILARRLVTRLRYTARNGAGRYTAAGRALLERAADDVERLMREGSASTRLPFTLTEAENVLLTEVFILLRLRRSAAVVEAADARLLEGVCSEDVLRELLTDMTGVN